MYRIYHLKCYYREAFSGAGGSQLQGVEHIADDCVLSSSTTWQPAWSENGPSERRCYVSNGFSYWLRHSNGRLYRENQATYIWSGKTSYCVTTSLEARRMGVKMFVSFWKFQVPRQHCCQTPAKIHSDHIILTLYLMASSLTLWYVARYDKTSHGQLTRAPLDAEIPSAA